MAQFVKRTVLGGKFETPERYSNPETLRIGVSGIICSSWDQITKQYVAVKKILEPFRTPATTQSVYREVKLLLHLNHENIIRPLDIFISPSEDIYLVTALMQTDLRTILDAKSIGHEFVQFFLYQILRGLKYVHSAGVVHRDLQPEKILINENCDLKICDFGLARVQEPCMSGYVTNRFYRAPEVILAWQMYNEQVDIWSAGCIFAEMLQGKPIFAGKDHVEQFSAITELLGTPDEEILAKTTSPQTLSFIQSLPYREGTGLSSVFPQLDSKALGLLERMLNFDPRGRISASEALMSPYLASYHDPTDEPVADATFDWTFDETPSSINSWKEQLYAEVLQYHKQAESHEVVKKWTQTTCTAQN